MTEHQDLPVAGYVAQSNSSIDLVNVQKEMEERLLRHLDSMKPEQRDYPSPYDQRWLAIARTHFEQGFMALNRAVFKPTRVSLPED